MEMHAYIENKETLSILHQQIVHQSFLFRF